MTDNDLALRREARRAVILAEIAFWRRNEEAIRYRETTEQALAPLCFLFAPIGSRTKDACHGCPVAKATDQLFCGGTPVLSIFTARVAWHKDRRSAAKREVYRERIRDHIRFLEQLLPEAKTR